MYKLYSLYVKLINKNTLLDEVHVFIVYYISLLICYVK
jgi:hypothetical protein